jgi:hypothetical protein
MIRVEVNGGTAYFVVSTAQVGDRVVALYGQEYPKFIKGTITKLSSDYTGPCRRAFLIHEREDESVR